MLPQNLFPKLFSLDGEQCAMDIKSDTRNTYSYDKLIHARIYSDVGSKIIIDTVNNPCTYNLFYSDGEPMNLKLIDPEPMFDKKSILNMTSNVKYRFPDKVYDIERQIPMIKLFIATYISRKFIKYNIINENLIELTFFLFNDDTHIYDKRITMILDSQTLVDKSGLPIIIESKSLFDHILLKGFIKLSNIMKINIGDINVNSLVGAALGGGLFKLSIPNRIALNLESVEFTVENLLLDRCETTEQREEQSSWISDNILKVITDEDVTPYNQYARIVHNLHKNNMLLGMNLNNSFMYIVSGMWTDQYGGLNIKFYNIFTGNDIEVSFASVIYGLNQIGVLAACC